MLKKKNGKLKLWLPLKTIEHVSFCKPGLKIINQGDIHCLSW
jgi:hypothetical protein